jgi:large subunit ribosomal protein L15
MRGGRGNAGTTTHRYIQIVKQEKATGKKIIGKYGFKRPQKMIEDVETINVSHLDQSIDTLVEDGLAQKDGKSYTINLAEIGVDKLLAQGNVHRSIDVTVEKASSRAVSKIEEAGGSVTLIEN